MNEQEKKKYMEGYKKEKEHGVPFFPDIIFKDTIGALIVFVILAALAYFMGAPLEPRANPADTTYTPRPEWYFLFLFQALKYFPGELEVLGAMVLPGLFILVLILLPFIDKSPKRHFLNRPYASVAGLVTVAVIVYLTVASILEAPPPQEAAVVDPAAALYAANCANCHGSGINVPPGTDLHQIIAAGTHAGMPAWGGDLDTDEIDELAGFILSPTGSALFTKYCVACHAQPIVASGNPAELQRVFDEGAGYPPHQDVESANWKETLSAVEINGLLNFLAAPDGQRLFVVNCSGCHGQGVGYSGDAEELAELIKQGGQHLDMPSWKDTLTAGDIDVLAAYVTSPKENAAGNALFKQHCASCHGDKVPQASDKAAAVKAISTGGAHLTMPVWGDLLTVEQLDALVQFTLESGKGGAANGARLFAENCSDCHGNMGQGGPNPSRHGDTIAPINSSEYLKTRENTTIRDIIAYGQPDFGMSPFGEQYGGQFDDDQLDAVVAFIRSWEANPPAAAEAPAETANAEQTPVAPAASYDSTTLTGEQLFSITCARCHGLAGIGDIAPAFNTSEFQSKYDDQAMFTMISFSRAGTPMTAWSDKLSEKQIGLLIHYIRSLDPNYTASLTYSGKVGAIIETNCLVCHNATKTRGGWDATSYQSVMSTGENAPVIVPGNIADSILAKSILGQAGAPEMPPLEPLPQSDIQTILDWIAAGAPEN